MADEESVSISSDLGNANDPLDADVVTTPAETTMPSTEAEEALITTTRSSNFLHIVEPLPNITVNSGKEVRLKCHVKGHPKPKVRWFKNEAPLEAERRGRVTIRKEHDGSKIRIRNLDVPDTGYYRCEASNGFDKVETTGILKVLMVPGRSSTPLEIEELEDTADYTVGDVTHIDEDVEDPMSLVPGASSIRAPNLKGPGTCQPYKGTACAKFLQNTTVFTSGTQSIAQIEEGLMAAFSLVPKQTDLSTQCAEYAVPSLCYHMLPVCDEHGSRPEARDTKIRRQLCRDECELLETEICRKEYAVANQHPVLKEFTPDCADLPPTSSVEHRRCIRLGLRAPTRAEKLTREECYEGNGQGYTGVQKMTESGEECRKWDGVHYPDMAHHNYCRNPNGNMVKPWCYNAKTEVPEKCHIAQCTPPPDNMMNNLVLIAASGAALLLLIAIVSLCICIRRRMAKKQSKSAFKANIKANPLELNALIPKYQIHGHVPEVQMNNLRFLDVLGDGAFGKVYAGDLMTDGGIRPVIIRMAREGGGAKLKQDFLRELAQWSDYRHPNVSALVGSHQGNEPFALLFEHSTCGDLHEYLEAMADHSPNWKSDKSNVDCHSSVTYLQMATQVAAGLEYLAANLFVHRDVATKNCWVFDNGQIKVADHGVGPSRYPMDYSRYSTTVQAG
ncbi:hypothetical protein RvY_05691-2 [Ramazzottius varieornatus]|uniref:Receptor protein-tyrosine kinase n=1 Tax=Ramazzottius varieornatus TaxID=947166 RepID=A0A1D1UVX0_RAMVA|nr:hypothetical protein RvY_05691-2 [Ramazzottius varieornatus]